MWYFHFFILTIIIKQVITGDHSQCRQHLARCFYGFDVNALAGVDNEWQEHNDTHTNKE